MGNTWKLVRNAKSWLHPRPTEGDAVGSGVGPSNLFSQILQILMRANVFVFVLRTTALGRRHVINKLITFIRTEETLKSSLIRIHFT